MNEPNQSVVRRPDSRARCLTHSTPARIVLPLVAAVLLSSCSSWVHRVATIADPQGAPYSGELAITFAKDHWIAPVTASPRETFKVRQGTASVRVPYRDDVAFILQRPSGGSVSLSKAEIKEGGVFELFGRPAMDGAPRHSGYTLTLTKP